MTVSEVVKTKTAVTVATENSWKTTDGEEPMQIEKQGSGALPGQIEGAQRAFPKVSDLPPLVKHSVKLAPLHLDRPTIGESASFSRNSVQGAVDTIPAGPANFGGEGHGLNRDAMPSTMEENAGTTDYPDEPESCHGEVAEADEPDFEDDLDSANSVELREMTDDQFINEIMEHFNDYDADRDEASGTIPAEYLGTLLDILYTEGIIEPVDDDELEMLRNDMDADGNGLISAEEFKDVLERRRKGVDFTDEELREAFGVFDHHSRGYITPMELRQAMKAIFDIDVPALDANSMVMAASRTGGDRIDLEEFMGIIRWKRQYL